MSNRDSLGFGDLIPQDVVDILSQEKHSNKSRKKRSHSLGRALGWLKGKKKKELGSKGQNLGLGPALDLALDGPAPGNQGGHKGGQKSGKQAHQPAVPKLDDDDRTPAAPLFQENVFIETSRPEYLENLHSEALEGLKMMQQEETNNGVEYQDSESTVSTTMVHTDGEGGGFMTDSTIADSTSVVSVKSSVSSRSSRSGLTRQESTFRPLNSGKKAKRRKHRKTVAGIPQHVQQELGLDRVGWTLTQTVDEEQLYNGESDLSPTVDSPQQTALPLTGTTNAIHPLSKDQLDQLAAANSGHVDDLALLHHLDPNLPADQRPHSLAVPWMTTGNSLQQEPPSPVITMSPQAAYMSKIIPNAVLPPSIDVVEISRGRSRNSVRTVSKSSLVLSSPAPSRASSRASTRTNSSKASTITSASRQNPPNMSDSSCWSNSESSETLVSDSSTISSSSTLHQKRSQDGNASAKEHKVSVHPSSKGTSNGNVAIKREMGNKDGQFVRSLSIMKPKRAPPPPSRSYSLHSKMKRRSRDLAEIRVIPGVENVTQNKQVSSPVPSKPIDSPGYNADTSSLDDSTGFSPIRSKLTQEEAPKVDVPDSQTASKDEDKKVKVVSPSSGYSSQEGTSAQSLKQSHSSSPRHKRGLLAKLQRLFPGSAPSSPTPPTATPTPPPSEDVKLADNLKLDTSVEMSPSVRALRELFNIPPHPKVHAPPPPPPEVWVHSRKSIELLLGPPVPDDIYAIIKKNPKDKRPYRQSPSASTEGSMKVERKNKAAMMEVDGSTQVTEVKKVPESVILKAEVHKENIDRLAEKNQKVTEKVSASDILSGMLVKAVVKREERLAREEEAKKSSTKVASPESAWPPPPPPVGQMVITDEMEFPLPPPPMFGEALVIPVQVPPAESSSTTTTLDIPPPPSYSAPPPPVGALTPATLRRISPLPPIEEVPFTPPPEEVSPPQLPVQVSPPFLPPPPMEVSHPAPPKEVTPPPPLIEAIRLKQLKEVSPPPPPTVLISPAPPEEVIPPPPPLMEAVQLQPPKKVSPPPPPKQVTSVPPTLSKVVTPPPPPPIEVVQPQKPKKVSSSPPKEVASVPPTPPKEVTLPPIIQLQPSKEVTPLPPPVVVMQVQPPKEVNFSPTPPQEVVLLPPSKDVSPPQPPKEISPPPPPEDVSPPPQPQEVILLPPPQEITTSPPPPKEVIPSTPPEEVSPAQLMEVSPPAPPPPVIDTSTTLVTVVAPPPVQETSPPPIVEVSTLSTQEEATPVSILTPPQSIPPPPPKEETTPPEEPETIAVLANSILTPPQSIPPPPPIQPPPEEKCLNTDSPVAQETLSPPTPEVTEPAPEKAEESAPTAPETILGPPTLSSVEPQPSPEQSTIPPVAEEASPVVTPSLLQTVKLRSVNSSPEPKAPEQAEVENTSKDNTNAPTSNEAPQKPIRQSLILTSPTSTSPPTVVISQPALPKSQSLVIPTTTTSTSPSPTKKSPPAMTASPSMNLQEAIRLRTAARSRENSTTRLSLHSPTSPIDPHKSPTSTASFIFSKSNRRMVIEAKPVVEKKSVDLVTKVQGGAEVEKKGLRVPPPVAKKPKSKGKEVETSEVMEQTAGQEAQKEGIEDVAEKASGTAGTV